jgi:hypothetical protein
MRIQLYYVSLALTVVLVAPAIAVVDLVTLPRREGTQLTIYNSEDITMVREHRLLAERLVGAMKPGNAGGAKGPQFKDQRMQWLRRKLELDGQGLSQYPDSRLEREFGLLNLDRRPRRYSWAKP